MSQYEYRVIPAPRRAKRAKGARTPEDKFARTLSDLMNEEAREGWEFQRAESLPVEQKKGMLSSATESYQSVLVFRRALHSATRSDPGLRATSTPPQPSLRLGPAHSK